MDFIEIRYGDVVHRLNKPEMDRVNSPVVRVWHNRRAALMAQRAVSLWPSASKYFPIGYRGPVNSPSKHFIR